MSPFDHLPIFATDLEISQAIVGKARAAQFKRSILLVMAGKPGFPKVDGLHGGRSVPAVRQFYSDYLRMPPAPVEFRSKLDRLPLFATDDEIAAALVGRKLAAQWINETAPYLQNKMPGFPRVDPLHDGRPVPVLKVFYASYSGMSGAYVIAQEEDREDLSAWKKSRRPNKTVWSGS